MWKWLKCALGGHVPTISVLESIDGTLWATRETCNCGRVGKPVEPGATRKMWHDHYKDHATEYPDLFQEER